jgi:hypothetical protein
MLTGMWRVFSDQFRTLFMMQVSLPLGYHQYEKAGGTPVLKMICPNHLRIEGSTTGCWMVP